MWVWVPRWATQRVSAPRKCERGYLGDFLPKPSNVSMCELGWFRRWEEGREGRGGAGMAYFLPLSFVAWQNGHFGGVGLAAAEEVRLPLLAEPGRGAGRCRFLAAENGGKTST